MGREAERAQAILDRDVRLHVFHHIADTGQVPQAAAIAASMGRRQDEIEQAIQRLATANVWILAPRTVNIWAANPFSAVPSNFRVDALGSTYWGVCIWDALGIAAVLHADAAITTRCGDCDAALVLEVRDGALVQSEGIVHFAVPASQWWENVMFT